MLEDGFISLFRVCFQYKRRSLSLIDFPSLQTDWPIGQTPHFTALLSGATRLHHPSVWVVVASNLQTTHLSGQVQISTDPIFRECDTTNVWVGFVCNSNPTPRYFLCVLFWKRRAVIFKTFSLKNVFFYSNNFFFNQWVPQSWSTSWWVAEENAGEKWS